MASGTIFALAARNTITRRRHEPDSTRVDLAVGSQFELCRHAARRTSGTDRHRTSSDGCGGRGGCFAVACAALRARGVAPDQVRSRVAALSDAEAAQLADQIDAAPAGGNDVLGTIVFVFVLLLITDILGFTKIFPFTRSIR
jgi:hypothetical protein